MWDWMQLTGIGVKCSSTGVGKKCKSDVPLRPMISTHGTSTYKLSKFLKKILQAYTGNNFSFVKDSKGLPEILKGKNINSDETLVSFDVRALFTSILVPVALEVINRKLTAHISQEGLQDFLEHSHMIPKDKLIILLELVCSPSNKQLQGATIGSSVSPVTANIYMGYSEDLALGSQCPIPTP